MGYRTSFWAAHHSNSLWAGHTVDTFYPSGTVYKWPDGILGMSNFCEKSQISRNKLHTVQTFCKNANEKKRDSRQVCIFESGVRILKPKLRDSKTV